MSALSKELVFLILKFCDEEGFKETAHTLERESGLYFDMKVFGNMLLTGDWKKAERYLSGFTKVDDNRYSTKIYFEIRKQNFLEALDIHDRAKALDILMKDLKVFAPGNEELFKEMTRLLTMDNIREHESLSMYRDTQSARKLMMNEVEKIIKANPLFHGKLNFPSIKRQRLRRLINQSLNWQHLHCSHPRPNPNITTLFVDHVCQPQHSDLVVQSTENSSLENMPSEATSMPVPTSLAGQNSCLSTVIHSAVSSDAPCLSSPTIPDGLEDSNSLSTRRLFGMPDEVTSKIASSTNSSGPVVTTPYDLVRDYLKNDTLESWGPVDCDKLPKTVARTLNEGSSPTSMDFYPLQQTLLLVGTKTGDIGLWEVTSGEKLVSRNFKVWDIGSCSILFKTALVKDPCVSVNRVTWSPDGSLFGVAYSKHIVQLYSYLSCNVVQQKLEIDAHVGAVNDLVFSAPRNQLLVITCGDDKTIKVWDAVGGVKIYDFEGHSAPVYSLCPHTKEHVHFIFSTSVDGNIKAWLYDNLGARISYDAPGLGCTAMAYGADDRRLFSCGTSKDGESFLVEWNETEGGIRRNYQGLQKNSLAVVQFDTTKDILAAGDDHLIKIWDMDKVELLTSIDADGGLPANPCIRFNKEGSLLAVFAHGNRIKILATDYGLQLLQTSKNCSKDAAEVLSDSLNKLAVTPDSVMAGSGVADRSVQTNVNMKNFEDVKSKISARANNKLKVSELFQTSRPSLSRSLQLPAHVRGNKISKLIYTNAGNAILALSSNSVHQLWKWPWNNKLNVFSQATTEIFPKLLQTKSGGMMTNDLPATNPDNALHCFALSKNDSYLLSASGGMISLFNMLTLKRMMTFMPPSPVATCIAFLPEDNNIIAIGMDDSTIVIYHVRMDEVISKLEGHSKTVTGLAFSNALNVLVSCGADAKIFEWNANGWVKQKSRCLQIPNGQTPVEAWNAHVQFYQDQIHFLAVYDTHLSIYDAEELECVKQWVPELPLLISQATLSCDSQSVYAAFVDGSVSIFDASSLEIYCRVMSTAYLPPNSSFDVYPVSIAAHPKQPTQFAVGLTNGAIYIIEPEKPGDKWDVPPPDDNKPEDGKPVGCDAGGVEFAKPN